MFKSGKNTWVLILFLLAGIVLGGFFGEYLGGQASFLSWLKFGKDFGLTSPLILELGVINLQLAFIIRFNVAGILGMILAVVCYRRL